VRISPERRLESAINKTLQNIAGLVDRPASPPVLFMPAYLVGAEFTFPGLEFDIKLTIASIADYPQVRMPADIRVEKPFRLWVDINLSRRELLGQGNGLDHCRL